MEALPFRDQLWAESTDLRLLRDTRSCVASRRRELSRSGLFVLRRARCSYLRALVKVWHFSVPAARTWSPMRILRSRVEHRCRAHAPCTLDSCNDVKVPQMWIPEPAPPPPPPPRRSRESSQGDSSPDGDGDTAALSGDLRRRGGRPEVLNARLRCQLAASPFALFACEAPRTGKFHRRQWRHPAAGSQHTKFRQRACSICSSWE